MGRCRKSCKVCDDCGKRPGGKAAKGVVAKSGGQDGDDTDPTLAKFKSCRALNRHKAGYLVYDLDFDDPDEGVAAGLEALRRAGVNAEDGAAKAQPPPGEPGPPAETT